MNEERAREEINGGQNARPTVAGMSAEREIATSPRKNLGAPRNDSNRLVLFALSILSLIGIASMAYATTRGPGIGGDATIYITAARNLLHGQGLGLVEADGSFRLLPYTPPLFPLLLAAFGLPGFDLIQVARWMNVIFFGASLFLIGYATLRFTRSALLSIVAAGLVLLSPVLARVYAWAMAEPLFLFTGFSGFFLSLAYARSPRRSILIWSAIACGLSFLARYIGVAFLVTSALVVLLLSQQAWIKRLVNAIVLGIVGAIPMAAWLIVDLLATRTVASRSIEAGTTLLSRVQSAGAPIKEVILNWLVPDSWIDNPPYPRTINQLVWMGAILGVILLVGWVTWRLRSSARVDRDDQQDRTLFAAGLAVLIVVYLAVTLGVYITTYPPITLDNRMLVPVHIATLLFVVCMGGVLAELEKNRRWVAAGVSIACLVFLGSYVYRTPRIIQQTHQAGLGYLMDSYQQSETVQAMRSLPVTTPMVTNELTQALFFTGRSAYPINEISMGEAQASWEAFGSDPTDPAQQAFRSGAALVIFDTIQQQLSDIYGEQAGARLETLTKGLFEAFHGSDGAIYYYKKP